MLEARVKDGGLGLPFLIHNVPLLWRRRLENFLNLARNDTTLSILAETSPSFQQWKTFTLRSVKAYGQDCVTSEQCARAAQGALYNSVDGSGLKSASLVPGMHSWISAASLLLQTGRQFISALHTRMNSLSTAFRTSRGRNENNTRCEACGRVKDSDTYCKSALVFTVKG
jgi:hypothetical protein